MQPKTTKTEELEATFNELAEQWVKKTGMLSNSASIMKHPAYQQIVELGEAALPLVFRELEKGQMAVHWPHVPESYHRSKPGAAAQEIAPPPGGLVWILGQYKKPGWIGVGNKGMSGNNLQRSG